VSVSGASLKSYIPFNRPYLTGQEQRHIEAALESRKLSGDGPFSQRCQSFFQDRYQIPKALLTTSCTDALEMSALLCGLEPGDEVLVPSYTFVSTALAFALRGARVVFVDSRADHPGMDEASLEALVTARTRAILPVHYAGVACDMDPILALASRHGLRVVEDAAQAVESTYRGRPLGTLGHMGAFSFHETKNIQCGEGGLIAVNDAALGPRAEILREKGTNRSAFFRGEVAKYNWVDMGSSYLPSDILAAMLWAQIEDLDKIQARRMAQWKRYRAGLAPLEARGDASLPSIPAFAGHNAHMFYLVCGDLAARSGLIAHLKAAGIHAVFHYQALHRSPFYAQLHDGRELPMADRFTDCLVRLPLYVELETVDQDRVIEAVLGFYGA